MRAIEKIESLTNTEIQAELEGAGIRPGAGSRGYERAKALIIGNTWMDESAEYDRIIAIICEYLRV